MIRCIRFVSASGSRLAGFALAAALMAAPALADSDYPPGLFENSPVVGPGQEYATPPASSQGRGAGAPQADYDAPPPGGYDAPPPPNPTPQRYRPEAYGGSPDPCVGIESRVFNSLDEVRRARARCSGRGYGAPPPPYPRY